ncbi:ENDO-13-14-BETA-D-GLUCANASE-LIKE PROTEIN [Salix viminalis]|uniref:ENDO-13-14-BETA-D-GLUCANASE-LIKE PROTEIN n=1 Tax=Salix viminalis TaxID=40686 RepID=A0A9Q0NXI6_SALVM|nr:ENDO-13-14-BETA-D-GLUCANASE-LIKE PROTEIN [Salix viminalis]
MSSPVCFENPPRLTPDYGAGTVQEFGGLKTYVTGASDSKLAILLIADAYGYEAPNLRKLADKIAAAGFFVLAPDFLYGDPVDLSRPGFDIEAWKKLHNTDKVKEDAKSVIATLKSKGVNSIGAAGFCWGGNVAVKLASSSNDIQAAVILHPGPLTIDEIKEVKIPIAVLGAEADHLSPPEQLKEFGEILSAKSQLASLVKIFPGVGHGWTVRYNVEDESAVKSAEEAHRDMLQWFAKFVK